MWLYNNEPFNDTPNREEAIGFVYLITELDTGMMYVGKKLFHKPIKKTITLKNGKKKRKTVYVDSNWREYTGSSESLNESITKRGLYKYKREILHLCKRKGELSYMELKEQIDREVLFREEYYNQFIGVKIHARHL